MSSRKMKLKMARLRAMRGKPKTKIVRVTKVIRMRRRSSRRSRTRTVYRTARRAYRAGRRRGLFGGRSGGLLGSTLGSLKEGLLYSTIAGKFAPQFAPVAQLYGEYKGGGVPGLLINELFVNQFLGRPSALGGLGLGNILGGLGLGGASQSSGGAV